ncbi:hypothetical protein ACFQZI_19415 [Mucilaginibacter lutimaris]|uniref:Lipoprotein n=1 Tax=Mucilaginibacter lutimaris TaxID=931629 RepID=A0ABW2ZLA2_9SPHI
MKKITKTVGNIAMALIMLAASSACDWGKSTTIVNKTDNLYQKIKYSGRVVFAENNKGIERITDNGYLEFEQNGRTFKAKDNGHGKISYEFDGGSPVTELDIHQKEFVAEAVTEIVKARGKMKN